MDHLPPYPDTDDGVGSDHRSTSSTSPWVYMLWAIGIALVLLIVILHLTGNLGPGGH